MADISQQLARGIDITTPLLQGIALQRQREQDVLAQQQFQQEQTETQIKNLNTSMKSLMEFGEMDAALDVFGEINKLTGVGGNVDIGKLKKSQAEGRLNFQRLTQQLTKSLHGDKNATDESKKATIDTFTSIMQREGGVVPPGGISVSPEVTELATQIRAEVPQPQVQPTVQPQITPQDEIVELRRQKMQWQSLVARTPQQVAGQKAAIEAIDGRITDIQNVSGRVAASKLKDEMAFARDVVASEKGISSEQVDPRDTFEKVKELRRVLPGEAGEKETQVQEARRISTLKKEFPKQKTRLKRLNREWNRLDKVVDRALEKVGPTTTGIGSLLTFVRGGEARDLQNLLNTIKANRGFSNLTQMRDDSTTGGALGQVSELENVFLQAVDGSLEQEQSGEQLRENLGIIKELLGDLRSETRDSFTLTYGEVDPESSVGTIRVREKSTGQTGRIPANEFNPDEYERL